jgi:hypothetical protein
MPDPRVLSIARRLRSEGTVATATDALVAAQLIIDAADELRRKGDPSDQVVRAAH